MLYSSNREWYILESVNLSLCTLHRKKIDSILAPWGLQFRFTMNPFISVRKLRSMLKRPFMFKPISNRSDQRTTGENTQAAREQILIKFAALSIQGHGADHKEFYDGTIGSLPGHVGIHEGQACEQKSHDLVRFDRTDPSGSREELSYEAECYNRQLGRPGDDKTIRAVLAPTRSSDNELWDASMAAEYNEDIFENMHQIEERMRPNPSYMDHQPEIRWSMRSVLIDWVVQVHLRFNLLPETLFLCINYIDRSLSVKAISLTKLQLVGATALFIAAKYEEIPYRRPSVQEIVSMVDQGYTASEILKAERFMLNMLQFDLGPMSFLRRISKADDYDLETGTLAKYLLEITIMDERFVGLKPSYLAAGAHCLARYMLRKGEWTLGHVHYSGVALWVCLDGMWQHSKLVRQSSKLIDSFCLSEGLHPDLCTRQADKGSFLPQALLTLACDIWVRSEPARERHRCAS